VVIVTEPAHQRIEISFSSPLRIVSEPPSQGSSQITVTYDLFRITTEGDHVMLAWLESGLDVGQ
jgi:hypothetical protein